MVSEIRGDGDAEGASKEMMEKLPDVMRMVGPLLGNASGQTESSHTEEPQQKPEKPKQLVHPNLKYDKNKAEKLMCALKPYLSQTRCDMIDKCLSLLQLGDVVTVLGGMEDFLKTK